ncbi:MAG: exonuclease [Proteobacteria bacterium]|nr:exonuclease [Pseudomonadota bacterium]
MTPLTGKIILFDTEFTAWEGSWQRNWSGPGEHRELIQIGAVLVDADHGFAELAHFDVFVKPTINPHLSAYITDLTGITQDMVDTQGFSVADALAQFAAFCGDRPVYSYGNDADVLAENCTLNTLTLSVPAGGFHDVRTPLEAAGVKTSDYSSGTVHRAVGANMDGHVHNALFDVRSIAAALRALRAHGKL